MAKVRPYYADGGLSAAYYDEITAADATLAGDIDFYAALAPEGGTVLEFGAGSGRVTQGLAERGLTVTGVDLSSAMLARAEARRKALPPEIAARMEFRRGDMTATDLKRTFDAVIFPFYTLAHVPAGTAWKNAAAVAVRHVKPGGYVCFHLPKLEVMRSLPPANSKAPVFDRVMSDGRRLVLFVAERTFRDPPGKLEQVLDYVVVDGAGRAVQRSPERLTYYMTDPTPFAEAAGLALDRPPQDLGGAGDLWVFRKP